MGAFFCVKKGYNENAEKALALFGRMGFAAPEVMEIGDLVLYVYRKMAPCEPNIVTIGNAMIASVGTPVYKGLGYTETLTAILNDRLHEGIQFDRLFGQYTLLICRDAETEIICDPLQSKHIFTDEDHNVISSSMLAVCSSIPGKVHINRPAVYEKLLTGIIMAPDTIFTEIRQIDRKTADQINAETGGIHITIPAYGRVDCSDIKTDRKEEIRYQKQVLRQYFAQWRAQCADGVDIGLSGGYDSRLVLVCLKNGDMPKLHTHTHQTENVHKTDSSIAKKMAECAGVPCHIVPTRQLEHCDDIDGIIEKSVLYFDGRNSFSIGGCGETYTAEYRRSSTQDTPFTMTGVGGELYRNVYCIGPQRMSFSTFLDRYVFNRVFRESVSRESFEATRRRVIRRCCERLGISENAAANRVFAQRYYCEILMPDGQGNAVDAYNQVSRCLAPFLEPGVIQEGYRGVRYHGAFGGFEAGLIDAMDHDLASITSSYGYPLDQITAKLRIKEKIRTLFAPATWGKLRNGKRVSLTEDDRRRFKDKLLKDPSILGKSMLFFMELFPELDVAGLVATEADRSVRFMAATIYLFRENIDYGV